MKNKFYHRSYCTKINIHPVKKSVKNKNNNYNNNNTFNTERKWWMNEWRRIAKKRFEGKKLKNKNSFWALKCSFIVRLFTSLSFNIQLPWYFFFAFHLQHSNTFEICNLFELEFFIFWLQKIQFALQKKNKNKKDSLRLT